ncbi:hypothetical protein Pint_30322 [Pistacia integerrima]|uniref:Uncharacterized protein n=1 Tax=Pistacia integerrima TaxID=434235 RepID=A0ACC0X0M4_9ROSI|nr:hypothetical protein Pint_30322 [Pistacia integerrima]
MLQNRLMQWQYVNARADAVKEKMTNQMENNLLYAWDTFTNLEHLVLHKKLQLQKEMLEMKQLDFILMSQGEMEGQHSSVSMMKECLHSVACKIPLIEGAKVDPQSTSIAIPHVLDLLASIKSILSNFSPSAGKTISLLFELVEAIAQEKLLMKECS